MQKYKWLVWTLLILLASCAKPPPKEKLIITILESVAQTLRKTPDKNVGFQMTCGESDDKVSCYIQMERDYIEAEKESSKKSESAY